MMSEKEFVELYCGADEGTRKAIEEKLEELTQDNQTDQKRCRRYPRDIDKIMEEYESKYSQKSNIYVTEVDGLISRSKDTFELVMNCIRFGYVLGRRAERNKRYSRNRK